MTQQMKSTGQQVSISRIYRPAQLKPKSLGNAIQKERLVQNMGQKSPVYNVTSNQIQKSKAASRQVNKTGQTLTKVQKKQQLRQQNISDLIEDDAPFQKNQNVQKHRFSDIYQPSCISNDQPQYVQKIYRNNSDKKRHMRSKTMIQPLNNNSLQYENNEDQLVKKETLQKYEQIVCITEGDEDIQSYDCNFASSLYCCQLKNNSDFTQNSFKKLQDFKDLNIKRSQNQTNDDYNWNFQAQYKANKQVLMNTQGDNDDVIEELISPCKKRFTPSQAEELEAHDSIHKVAKCEGCDSQSQRMDSEGNNLRETITTLKFDEEIRYSALQDQETIAAAPSKIMEYIFPQTNIGFEELKPSSNSKVNDENLSNLQEGGNNYISSLLCQNKGFGLKTFPDQKMMLKSQQDSESSVLESDETLHLGQGYTSSSLFQNNLQNTSNTTILLNTLNLNCEESIDSLPEKKQLQQQQQQQQNNSNNNCDSAKTTNLIEQKRKPSIFQNYSLKNNNNTPIFGELNESISIEQQIKEWEKNIHDQTDLNDEVLIGMKENTNNYRYSLEPFFADQKNITWLMRAILIDWMMEVCGEFCMKRETLFLAINYTDRYLCTKQQVEKWELQLVGATAMFMASKMEEIQPHKARDFAKSTDDGYTVEQINSMELQISKILRWNLCPTTSYTWINWCMNEWDNFISEMKNQIQERILTNDKIEVVSFKQPNESSYCKYRQALQILETFTLLHHSSHYCIERLILAILYLLIGSNFQQFTIEEIQSENFVTEIFLQRDLEGFDQLFSLYLVKNFEIQLCELSTEIQFVAQFIQLEFNYELPFAAQKNKEQVLNGHYEDFLAFQTHTPENLKFIKQYGEIMFN